ncbi:hypothetical protein MKEN_01129000 [Mycena kentingensis (nom. inval.)]|nr:hypothetical protein MKEN_01129000 [Mycena kentingensis (nom. inval.)]
MYTYSPKPKTREWWKHVLWVSRIKLIYARITLTKFTTGYFFLALFTSFTLVILQARIFWSNTEGHDVLSTLLRDTNVSTTNTGFSFLSDGDVLLCNNIPGQGNSNCTTLVHRPHNHMHVRELATPLELSFVSRADEDDLELFNMQQCATSLIWLHDVLTDARREDLVILAYQFWLLALSITTLLNESLPHLFAALAARALSAGWASFRVHGNNNLHAAYLHVLAIRCGQFDPMGDWWNRTSPQIVALVFNVLDLVLSAAISYKLFKVYASQTFSRVGASAQVHRIYKLILFFSVILQLAGFFTLASTCLWIGKIALGPIRQFADHFDLYLAVLIVTAVFDVPWLVLGWLSVRREHKILFLLFALISCILFAMAALMLISPLYRFVLTAWSFYATVSVTAYVLLVATSVLAIICRLQFGKGLAHFLRVTDMLDDGDFTPVTFTKGDESPQYDDKKVMMDPELAVLGYSYPAQKTSEKPATLTPGESRKISAFSMILSDQQAEDNTIHMSGTPALVRTLTPTQAPPPAHVVLKPASRSTNIEPPIPRTQKPAERSAQPEAPAEDAPRKPAPAVVRSGSVPPRRGPSPQGLPSNPSSGRHTRQRTGSVTKPAGNFF